MGHQKPMKFFNLTSSLSTSFPYSPSFAFLRKNLKSGVLSSTTSISDSSSNSCQKWTSILRSEELPKGIRKLVQVDGVRILLFWYRNEIYAIESRSPAEGAYSQSFFEATFTKDYCIVCPSTGTLFSIKTGEIVDWYPNNPVLRTITPKEFCRQMCVYPVKIDQGAIFVDASSASSENLTMGGADTAQERNNVYGLEPKIYLEGTDPDDPDNELRLQPKSAAANAITLLATLVGGGILATGGTAYFIYYENLTGLAIFWVSTFSIVAAYIYRTTIVNKNESL